MKGHFGELENFTVVEAGKHHKKNEVITDDLMHEYQHAVEKGHILNGIITLHDGSKAKVNKKADEHMKLIIKKPGKAYKLKQEIEGKQACDL